MTIEYCPGGYLKLANGLCGATGNRCVDKCAYDYLEIQCLPVDPQQKRYKEYVDEVQAKIRRDWGL